MRKCASYETVCGQVFCIAIDTHVYSVATKKARMAYFSCSVFLFPIFTFILNEFGGGLDLDFGVFKFSHPL